MSRFAECLKFVLEWESVKDKNGNVIAEHDPRDPGGTTKYGIDQRSHPSLHVAKLTLEQATDIYHAEKWLEFRCDQMPEPWDLVVFDSSINPGEGWAPTALQRAVGATPDGFIGPKTLQAVREANNQDLIEFLRARCVYYRNRPEKINGKPFRSAYLSGWLNRTAALATHAVDANFSERLMAA